jgi:RNA polymerase sigma factor (sigma-70 family)
VLVFPRNQSQINGQEYDWLEELAEPQGVSHEDRLAARELLEQALKQLPARDAACIVLHFVSGEPYAEIAARLNSTEGAVRRRVSRALVVLRRVYARLVEEENEYA